MKNESITPLTDEELGRRLLQGDVDQGNVGMVLEHAGDSNLTDAELLQVIADALQVRASQKDEEAHQVDGSWGEFGRGKFEKTRANHLRTLAARFNQLRETITKQAAK